MYPLLSYVFQYLFCFIVGGFILSYCVYITCVLKKLVGNEMLSYFSFSSDSVNTADGYISNANNNV